MLTSLRNLAGNYYLRKDLTRITRNRKLSNLADAKRIGIVYQLNEVQDYDIVAELVAKLQQDHKEIKALGFVASKNLVSRFLPKLSFDFFSASGVNWFYKPVDTRVKDFINNEYDLLIDLSLSDSLPLKFIAGLSAAHCRVGRFDEKNKDCFDLMITMGERKDLKDYIEQIMHYLTIINSNNE